MLVFFAGDSDAGEIDAQRRQICIRRGLVILARSMSTAYEQALTTAREWPGGPPITPPNWKPTPTDCSSPAQVSVLTWLQRLPAWPPKRVGQYWPCWISLQPWVRPRMRILASARNSDRTTDRSVRTDTSSYRQVHR
jgi:hypothetical protein